jgi:hypothetical protein
VAHSTGSTYRGLDDVESPSTPETSALGYMDESA